MRINVHGGHNNIVKGARGFFDEVEEDRKVKDLVIFKLKSLGHTVYDCTDDIGTTQSTNLSNIKNKCNEHVVDIDVSIHFNAYNGVGNGVEVLVYSEKSKSYEYAKRITNSIAELGFKNRGVKVKDSLYILRKTNSPAMIIECCFCDNKNDSELYSDEYMANAIVKGITGQVVTPQVTPQNILGTYVVTASDLSVRNGPGTNYKRKTHNQLTSNAKQHDEDKDGCLEKGTKVTVKEWENGWARIPSGWICGKYLKKN